jgi:glycosyltransferase involved in cell wall biosynthesis
VRTLPRRDRPQLLLREVGSPSIAQYHDPYRQNRVAYRILRHLYRRADRIIALTDGARRDLVQNFSVPQRSISVMRANAVIPPAMVERIAGWDGESGRERDLIVCVGRLSPEKDHSTLLRAVSLLPAQRPWRLAIVGEGPERPALEAMVGQLGLAQRVTFTGYVADPFAWMMRARLAVCASIYEGLCNAIIEALACGTPVVSTDCPYGPREILQDGRFGTLTPVGDARALAAGIAAALDQVVDRRFLTARGLNYTAESAAAKFLEIVADLSLQRGAADRTVVAASTP